VGGLTAMVGATASVSRLEGCLADVVAEFPDYKPSMTTKLDLADRSRISRSG
jgi:hypothetical protein